MSNTEQIKEALKSLIVDNDRAFVAMLSGEWGIGKTYFWKKFTKEHLKNKSVVYISLFGKNSLADIEADIIAKLYRYNKNLKKYTKHLDTIGNMASKAIGLPINVSIGSLLSLFTSSDFKNVVICFDDFERLSDKVSLKDVMGLISQFKEQKECKVIMILNERELDKLSDIDGKKHAEIFALYKEKIIDYSFHYQPSQEEQSEAISEDKDIKEIKFCEHQTIYDFFEKIELKNIRTMKQSLYLLKQFSFIASKGYDKQVIDEFVEIALNLFVFKIKCNYTYEDFIDFRGYKKEEHEKEKMDDSIIKYGKDGFIETIYIKESKEAYSDICLKSYYNLPFKSTFEGIEKMVYCYLDNHDMDKTRLLELLEEENANLKEDN